MEKIFLMKELENRGYEVTTQKIEKNSSLVDALVVQKRGSNIGVSLYLDNLPDDVNEVVKVIESGLASKNAPEPDIIKKILNKEYIKENVFLKIAKAGETKYVARQIADGLNVIMAIKVDFGQPDLASVSLTSQLLKIAGVDEEALWDKAISELSESASVEDMAQMISQMLGIPVSAVPAEQCCIVVSNKQKVFGAVQLLNTKLLDELAETYETDRMIIIPSSVHEFIVMPHCLGNASYVNSMVREVNNNELKPEDILADHAYYYEVESKALVPVPEMEQARLVS